MPVTWCTPRCAGAVVAVFQWGWAADLIGVEQTGPIMSMMPIFMVGVVFGLAMDYKVFLVTRMREVCVHGASPSQAIVTGFRHGARVVTAAAVIMISVFAGFIGSNEAMVRMIGFGLAFAVFVDAFIVRMTIVPAVLALLGKRAWWLPKWLDKALPNVDVEGEALPTTSTPRLRTRTPSASRPASDALWSVKTPGMSAAAERRTSPDTAPDHGDGNDAVHEPRQWSM